MAQATPEERWFKEERSSEGDLRLCFQPRGEPNPKYVPAVNDKADNEYTPVRWGDALVASFACLADHFFALEQHFKKQLTTAALLGLKHILEPFVFKFIQGGPVPTFPWDPHAANGDAARLAYAAYQLWASFIGLYFCSHAVLSQADRDQVSYIRRQIGLDAWLTPGVRLGEPPREGRVREALRVWSAAVVSRLQAAGFHPHYATLAAASVCAHLPGDYPGMCSCGRPKLSDNRLDRMQSLPSFCGRDDKRMMSRDPNDCRTGYHPSSLVLQAVDQSVATCANELFKADLASFVERERRSPSKAELKAIRDQIDQEYKGDPLGDLILDLCKQDGALAPRRVRLEIYKAVGGTVLGIALSVQQMIDHMDVWAKQAMEISAEADPRPEGQPRRLVGCGVAMAKAGVVLRGGVAELAGVEELA